MYLSFYKNLITKNDLKLNKKLINLLELFKVIRVIGKGTFGKVMLVEKIDTKELLALKSIRI